MFLHLFMVTKILNSTDQLSPEIVIKKFEFLTESLQKIGNFENLHDRPSPKN